MIMRFRATYLHRPTSAKIMFTVEVEMPDDPGSAAFAMGRRAAQRWIDETGLGAECVYLGVVGVTDKMSVLP
jgi:hypothetical protein